MKKSIWSGMSQFVMVGQLGLSLLMPLLICLLLCYLAASRFSLGGWIYIPGFFFGLGGSCTTAWKVYQSVMRKQEEKGKQRRKELSFNRHL